MRTSAAIGILLLVCGSAFAQNALDRPLDRNTQVGASRINPARPNLTEELRLRNAIVTGNAAGGLSFRGDVGYVAPGEFFGALGSNETFSFRRDSFYSGLGGLGIRGTDALQYQFAMTTGNAPPPGFLGAPTLSRSGAGAPVQRAEPGAKITRDSNLRRASGDGDGLMSLRSPSAFAATRSLEPMILGRQATKEGSYIGVSASPLLGLTVTEREQEKREPRPGQIDTRAGEGPAAPAPKEETKVDAGMGKSPYDELLERIKSGGAKPEEPAGDPKAAPSWQAQLDELRKQLGESPTKGPDRPARPGPAARPGEPKPEEGAKPEAKDLEPTAIERIRNAAGDVRELAAKGFDAFSSHMQAGQEHMAAGRYFDAEERFTAALSLKAGDPMAAIGRIHAQLGAGMFLSAAINLRSLLTEHPEVAPLKYEAKLLPAPERIVALQERLAELAAKRDGKQRDLGLLSAYLGFQSGNAEIVKRALALVGEAPTPGPNETPPAGPDQLQKLAELLTKLWLPAPKDPAPSK